MGKFFAYYQSFEQQLEHVPANWVSCMYIFIKIYPYIKKTLRLRNCISKTRNKLEKNLREIEGLKTSSPRITIRTIQLSIQKAWGNFQRNQSTHNAFFSSYKKKTTFQRPRGKKIEENVIVEINNAPKPAKNGGDLPKYFNCNLYGHISKNCTKSRRNSLGKGLEKDTKQ